MKEYFLKLFKYNEWANNQILELLAEESFNDSETLKLFSHIITAQRMWLDRILNKKIEYQVWQVYNLEGCITLSKENSSAWLKFVERLSEEDLSKIVNYVNTKGNSYGNSIEDILTHVINHSSYHRAQIARQLRNIGNIPPYTDYIEYRRKIS